MLLINKGIKTSTYFIPPFELNEGDFVTLNLFNDLNIYKTQMFLKDIFCGKIKNENVVVNKNLTFVNHLFEPEYRRLFYPITIGEFLKKNANLESTFATKIYDFDWINEKTKINTLPGNLRKFLALFATLSKTNHIVFDVVGQDFEGIKQTYEIVLAMVKNGGSAILLDSIKDKKHSNIKYIEMQKI